MFPSRRADLRDSVPRSFFSSCLKTTPLLFLFLPSPSLPVITSTRSESTIFFFSISGIRDCPFRSLFGQFTSDNNLAFLVRVYAWSATDCFFLFFPLFRGVLSKSSLLLRNNTGSVALISRGVFLPFFRCSPFHPSSLACLMSR